MLLVAELHQCSNGFLVSRDSVRWCLGGTFGRLLYFEAVRRLKWFMNFQERLVTTATVSKWLGVAARTIRLWAECGELPSMKVGKHWRFRQTEIQKWLENGSPRQKAEGSKPNGPLISSQ